MQTHLWNVVEKSYFPCSESQKLFWENCLSTYGSVISLNPHASSLYIVQPRGNTYRIYHSSTVPIASDWTLYWALPLHTSTTLHHSAPIYSDPKLNPAVRAEDNDDNCFFPHMLPPVPYSMFGNFFSTIPIDATVVKETTAPSDYLQSVPHSAFFGNPGISVHALDLCVLLRSGQGVPTTVSPNASEDLIATSPSLSSWNMLFQTKTTPQLLLTGHQTVHQS